MLREFLKLSRQSPRSRACTDFDSLPAYTRWRSYRGSRQGLVQARTLARCSRKSKAGMPHDTPYLEYSTISLLFVTNILLISCYFVFITRDFRFIEKTNLLSLPPSAILFLSIFVIIFSYTERRIIYEKRGLLLFRGICPYGACDASDDPLL